MISITDLSFRYPGATEDTLKNVNLHIKRGDFVAVVGGNGSGKTTLCKTFNGLIPHYWNGDFAGEVRVDGVDTCESTVAELSHTVGYVYQDFQNQLVRPTVRDEVSFAPINFGLAEHAERTASILNVLGIDHLSDRFVWQLSGGQAHLTALGSVLSLAPDVVVVDEPVAELDPARAHEVYRRLAELNEAGLTVITIEHHAEFIAEYTSSVILMADGAPVWHLPIDEAMQRSDELVEHGIPAPQIVQACRKLGLAHAPRTVDAAREVFTKHQADTSHISPESLSFDSPLVARARGVSHGYKSVSRGITPVLQDLDLDIHVDDRIALVGGNGAGKSTLLRLLAGIIVPRSGDIEVDSINTRTRSGPQMTDTACYLYQHPEHMFLKPSIGEDIALFPETRGNTDVDVHLDHVLDKVRLTGLRERDGRTLSGGQQRRATLAIGLMMRPKLLLLDEPTSSLDVTSRHDVTTMLAELSDTITATVVATHDMSLVAEWANRVIVLNQGRIVGDMTPRDLFARPDILQAANLVPPPITTLSLKLDLNPTPLTVDEFARAFSTVTL